MKKIIIASIVLSLANIVLGSPLHQMNSFSNNGVFPAPVMILAE
ncbi:MULTISPECIES: hypothetical protein [Francisella]|uniref:Uncharacterized protein n=1 Tax=Francisella philomiragia TaxID=28110 RepID=A0AAW3DDP7_9GAMM|nr:hypothetical protein [Francisella philomiragia]AJI55446.1 hypothetical protein LA56_401 [Francisella philomiragia]KFJ43903.1 hypothetical protein DR78_1855 [Francisella philomiragia]